MRTGNVSSCLWWQSDPDIVDGPAMFFAKRVKREPKVSELKSVGVAAFDMDGTLIKTKSGYKWPSNGQDWKWLTDDTLRLVLKQAETHKIVIFTNQGGAGLSGKLFEHVSTKVADICKTLAIPVMAYAATKDVNSQYRKPATGMWDLMVKQMESNGYKVELSRSFFVGDAAGRSGDFSDCDIEFARAVGIDFKTPEEWLEKWAKPEAELDPVKIESKEEAGSVDETESKVEVEAATQAETQDETEPEPDSAE